MRTFKGLSWMLTNIPLICFCACQGSFVSIDQRLKKLDDSFFDIRVDMINMEKRMRGTIEDAKTSLRIELKETIRDQVRERAIMGEIVQGETFRNTVKNEVDSGLRYVKQGYHKMKRQYHRMSTSLQDFQEQTGIFHEFLLKKADLCNGQNTSEAFAVEKHRLELELQKSNVSVAELKHEKQRLLQLKESCQFQVSQLKTALSSSVHRGSSHHVNSTSTSPVLKKLVTTSVTTPRPRPVSIGERSRILIARIWSSNQHQFRQLNLHNNSLNIYSHQNLSNLNCVAYLAKTNELLISLYKPDRILASALDTGQVRVLREGVRTYGMAVDDGRGVVFMTTHNPKHSISRMSTQGENFTTIIDLSKYGYSLRQITLDTRRKNIYWCNVKSLFTVKYDGQGLATIATGWGIAAVTLDQTAGVLYYNIWTELMKITVSNNVSERVIILGATPWNMILYRGIIYYGGWSEAVFGAVNVTHNTVAYSLESKSIAGFHNSYVCLIP